MVKFTIFGKMEENLEVRTFFGLHFFEVFSIHFCTPWPEELTAPPGTFIAYVQV